MMIEQKVEIANQQDFTLAGCLKQVEKAGRICYNSESKITDDSYEDFTKMLIRNEHYSPFGHGTLLIDLIKLKEKKPKIYNRLLIKFLPNDNMRYNASDNNILTTSARLLIEPPDSNFEILKEIAEFSNNENAKLLTPVYKKYYERLTFKATTSIDMTRELNRHGWSLDMNEMSTRYVKMNSVIKPYNWDSLTSEQQQVWITSTNQAFENYNKLIELGIPKQEARKKLPLETVTEVYYTAFRYQWEDVIAKRTAKGVHPQMIELMKLVKEKL